MSSTTFVTHYNYGYSTDTSEFEMNDSDSEVDDSGYISEAERLQNFMNAGQILTDFRHGVYDTDDQPDTSDDDLAYDPTTDPNFDLADASILLRNKYYQLKSKYIIDDAKSLGASPNTSDLEESVVVGSDKKSEKTTKKGADDVT